jgi:hypothetical protein
MNIIDLPSLSYPLTVLNPTYAKSLPTGVAGRLFDCNYMVITSITTEKQLH